MISVDISNIWGELSLPNLLAAEKEVFDAHMALTEGTGAGSDYLGWLKLPTEEQKLTAIAEIVRQGMSVARTEKYIEALLSKCPETPKKANVGAFLNSLTQSLQKIQLSGIPAVSERRETDSQIVLTITIPK